MLKLYRRKPTGPYYLRGTIAGVSIYESTGTDQKPGADLIRIKRETEIFERHVLGKAATITFAQAALTYLEAGGEARFLGKILEHIGPATKLSDIDTAAINKAANAIFPDCAPATINRQLITPISAVINMAANDGLTDYRKFKRRKTPKFRTRWLTPEEAERLLRAASPHLKPILYCLLGTGARTAEALSIEAQFFYPNTGEIWLPNVKNDHPRMIQLPPRALTAMIKSDLPQDGPIFLTPKGKPYIMRTNGGGQIAGAMRKACESADLGPDVTPHTLRHTWATWYYSATRDFGGLMDLGGWQRAEMAQGYRKIAPADLAVRLAHHGWQFGQQRAPFESTTPRLYQVK